MYENVKEQFKSVIRHSQGIEEPKVDDLFIKWEREKRKFIDLFGGLIYEWPVPVEILLSESEKKKRAMDFALTVSETFNNKRLADFIDDNLESFFDNKVSKSPEGSKIPLEMKLIKAFKYFESNKTELRKIQDIASSIIQEDKIKGILCFSVHPLDFLSSSENNYRWKTCHSLHGDYRSGNLSYMVDNCTFMVYLKSEKEEYLSEFGDVKWNSKKWRVLLHEHEYKYILFAGRQYPFTSKDCISTVLNIYNNILNMKYHLKDSFYEPWEEDYVSWYKSKNNEIIHLRKRYLNYKGELISLNDIVKDDFYSLNYNDLLRSSVYKSPYYTTPKIYLKNPIPSCDIEPMTIGGRVKCLHCEEELIRTSDTMRCDDCEIKYGTEIDGSFTNCSCCGQRYKLEDGYFIDDDPICLDCYYNECFVCECCGNVTYNIDKVDVSEESNYDYVCGYCYDNRRESYVWQREIQPREML